MKRLDRLTKKERSLLMAKIRSKNTKPEIAIRTLLYSTGYRYRLHAGGLPGRPDIVFKGRKKLVFVNGCFWHQHTCDSYKTPKTRTAFWEEKLERNRARDRKNLRKLRRDKWEVLVVWQCEIKVKSAEKLKNKLVEFME